MIALLFVTKIDQARDNQKIVDKIRSYTLLSYHKVVQVMTPGADDKLNIVFVQGKSPVTGILLVDISC